MCYIFNGMSSISNKKIKETFVAQAWEVLERGEESGGVEVEKTLWVLATCPLAAECINRSKGLCFQRVEYRSEKGEWEIKDVWTKQCGNLIVLLFYRNCLLYWFALTVKDSAKCWAVEIFHNLFQTQLICLFTPVLDDRHIELNNVKC